MKECASFKDAMSRRSVLKAGAIGLVPWLLSPSALSQVQIGNGEKDHALVVVFLRGGSDGLNMLVPYAEDTYYRERRNIAIAAPNDTRVLAEKRAERIDERFALHPSLRNLKKWYENESMVLVPAVGSQDRTRSHFEAMSAMERGAATGHSGEPSGWLARYLMETRKEEDSPLRAVAFADTLPDSFRGAPQTLVVQTISDFQLNAEFGFLKELEKMYAKGDSLVARAGQNTLNALGKIERLDTKNYKPSGGVSYPPDSLGQGLRETACLLKSNLGMQIACLETTGWDTHVAQGAEVGWHATLLDGVAKSLDAFLTDLGSRAKKITVVVMTEFGRRVGENAGLGTDHGRASVMMVFGNVKGGQIYGEWPGLGKDQLDEVGDLKPVNDYQKVLTHFLSPDMPEIANVWRA
jgi:uncharacterized protein (DUF1501 family)